MLSKLHFQYMIFLSFVVISLNWALFESLSVDFIFLYGNFIVVLFSLSLMYYFQSNLFHLKERFFIKRIFWYSLGIRIFAVLLYYILFFWITGTEFNVEATDELWYDETAKVIAESIWNGTFSCRNCIDQINAAFDDSGYIFFLTLIYAVFNKSVIVVRLIQALIGSATVVLIYRIGKNLFGEEAGKQAAILSAVFQPLILYVSIHLKETLMVYFVLLFIYHSIKIVTMKHSKLSIVLLVFSLIAILSFRTVLGFICFVSFIVYLSIQNNYSLIRRLIFLSVFVIASIILLNYLGTLEEVVSKSKRYAGIKVEKDIKIGGRSKELYESKGQSFAKYAGVGFLATQGISTPYPSMVKTNISKYNQTLQWYFAGGLLVWSYISFYAYVGLYYSIKKHFKLRSILIFNVAIYTAALISSVYIMSIRFNIIKLSLLIPFIGYGIVISNKQKKHFFRYAFFTYAFIMSIMVLLWNYVKLAGRGLI